MHYELFVCGLSLSWFSANEFSLISSYNLCFLALIKSGAFLFLFTMKISHKKTHSSRKRAQHLQSANVVIFAPL